MSAVTLAGLSKYGMGWNGERWGGRQVRLGVGEKKGICDAWLSSESNGHIKIQCPLGKWHTVDVMHS